MDCIPLVEKAFYKEASQNSVTGYRFRSFGHLLLVVHKTIGFADLKYFLYLSATLNKTTLGSCFLEGDDDRLKGCSHSCSLVRLGAAKKKETKRND